MFEEQAAMTVQLFQGDCLEVMRGMPDKSVDLVLTDPPYGIGITRNAKDVPGRLAPHRARKATADTWDDAVPDSRYFKEMFRVSRNQIVFGANYFWNEFYPSQCYIIWDKRGNLPKVPFCDTEFAWTSFTNRMSKKYTVVNHGFIRDSKDDSTGHPTQKPTELFKMILEDFTKPGDVVLDPFGGSFSVGVACVKAGRHFVGCEIDPSYYAIAQRRIAHAQMQLPLLEAT